MVVKNIQSIKQLNEKDPVSIMGLVTASQVRETAGGKPYADFTIKDKTGEISVKAWGRTSSPEVGKVVEVFGVVNVWQGTKSINADKIVETEEDIGQFVESSHRPAEDLMNEILHLLARVEKDKSKSLTSMVETLFKQYEVLIADSPAAKSNHHARRGGLVEHTHSMVFLADKICNHYEERYSQIINKALLIAGIVFHDIGKIVELSGSQGTEYTTTGRLVGHIPYGILILERALQDQDLLNNTLPSAETIDQLRHMILSHHGQLAWGSPVVPQTPEAILLHQLDMIDSRMDAVVTAMRQNEGQEWTSPVKSLGSVSLYLGNRE